MFTRGILRVSKECSRVILGVSTLQCHSASRSFLCHQIKPPNPQLCRNLSDKTSIGQIKPTMSIIFTCNVCQTRQAKTMSRKSYEKGVVLIRCDGCENLHLVADNLGWFRDQKTNVVDILREKEEEVRTLSDVDMLDLTDLNLLRGSSDDSNG